MEDNTTHRASTKRIRLEGMALYALMGVAFFMPIFFVPLGLFSLSFGKSLFIFAGVIATFVLYMLSVLEGGTLRLPAHRLFYAAAAIPATFLVSALFSKSASASFLGYGFEVGTFAFSAAMFLLFFLAASLYRGKDSIFYSYVLFFVSFGIIAVYQTIKFFFPQSLSFGIFTSPVTNLVGSWNDLGVFFGASALLALMTLELLPLNKLFRTLIYVSLVVSLLFLTAVNYLTLWIALAALSFIFFVYHLLSRRHAEGGHERKVSYRSIAVLGLSLVFIFAGGYIGDKIASAINVSNLEVRPSWESTWEIARKTMGENALLGSGPNTFGLQWQKYKPAGINESVFWNTDFSYGIGLIPTFVVTTGLLGAFAWFVFLGSYLWIGIRAIFTRIADPLSRFLVVSSFLVSLFFWISAVTYVPNAVIFALAFFFTGLFAAAAHSENMLVVKPLQLYKNARAGFVTVLAIAFALMLSVGSGYFVFRNLTSSLYFQQGVQAATTRGDFDGAEFLIVKAIGLQKQDLYYRTLAELNLAQLARIVQIQDQPVEQVRARFQQALSAAVDNGQKATQRNPANYQNFVMLGQVYESVVADPLKIEGAYEKAREAYLKGLELNPHNPEISLLLARLEAAKANYDGAREYVGRALEQKSNYADAYFLLSQIEVATGNLKRAIASVESGAVLAPDNAGVYFQLGLLKYNDSDWNGAIRAFEKALSLVDDYANAQYFLGLSYDKVGRRADAIRQFEELKATNPDNADVAAIVANLKAGNAPFAGMTQTEAATPEKAKILPIEQ